MKEKIIDWKEVDKESELCLKKCLNFESELKEIKKRNNKKSTQQIVNEVNEFIKEHDIPSFDIEINDNGEK